MKEHFTSRKGLLVLYLISIPVLDHVINDMMIDERITVSSPETQLVFSVLELIALLLPALAIMLDVTISYSRTGVAATSGEGAELRTWTFGIVGVSGLLAAVAFFILMQYMILPLPIKFAVYMVFLGIFGFSVVPIAVAAVGRRKEIKDAEVFIDAIGGFEPVAQFAEYPEEIQELIMATVDENWDRDEEPMKSDTKEETKEQSLTDPQTD